MEILEIIEKSERELKSSGAFERLEDIAFKNQMKVMAAFRKYKVSEAHFAVTSAQHAANARKYQQALNRRGIR